MSQAGGWETLKNKMTGDILLPSPRSHKDNSDPQKMFSRDITGLKKRYFLKKTTVQIGKTIRVYYFT